MVLKELWDMASHQLGSRVEVNRVGREPQGLVFTEIHNLDGFPADDLVIVRNDAHTTFESTFKHSP